LVSDASSTATVDSVDVRGIPGAQLSFDDLLEVRARIDTAARDGYRGIVVVQGTDTIEETAYILDLLVADGPTVVVTGAMRHASMPGADGPANLSDSIAVAADPGCGGVGVLIVLGGQVHAASLAQKTNTALPSAFSSWPGALGVVHEGRPRLFLSPRRRSTLGPVALSGSWPRVEVVTAVLGATGDSVERFIVDAPDGLVVAAFGGGHVPLAWVEPLERLGSTRPVVLCSRVGTGVVLESTYGFPGSERDLLGRGLIAAGNLSAVKATMALTLLLAGDQDPASFFADRPAVARQ
jgi:L-asparaginase